MPFSHVLAGVQFTEANFAGTAYANEQTGFPKALEKIVEHVASAWRSPSSTSLAVGTGAKTLTVSANRPFAVGQPVRIASAADPVNTFMDGSVTAYNETTGAMTVQVTSAKGSGTFASWTVSLGGYAQVVASPSPLPVASGGTGASTADGALANLGALKTANNLSELTATAATVRTNLGLGTVAVESTLPLAKGGTGATTAAAARTNLGLGAVALDNVVPLARGGTGGTDAATARTNLGLSALATTTVVPVANGGTGAANAATARTNLGLGTVAIESTVPLAKGGTGAIDAATARTNLGLGSVAVESTLPLAKGGTGATTAAGARTSLGLGAVALDNTVPVARGGTGAADAATARTNLGLGTVAVESTLPIAKGGTGATTAAQARANLGLTNGPTQARSNRVQLGAGSNYTNSQDVIPLTAGAGYLNGISLNFPQGITTGGAGRVVKVEFTVDGGTPHSFNVFRDDYEISLADGTYWALTGFIPLFVRFTTSIRVRLERTTTYSHEGTVNAVVSWSLD